MALLYNLVAVVPVLGSSKLRTVCDRPGPKAKPGGAGGTGRGAGSAGSTGGTAATAG